MTRVAGLGACSLALCLGLATTPAHAGDPVGLDPALHRQCVDAAASEGAMIDCAGMGVSACQAFWKQHKPERDPALILSGCTEAERQLWEADLSAAYGALLAQAGASHPEVVPDLRAMEGAWIAFRDARCVAEPGLVSDGAAIDIAGLDCRMRETARQTALLRALSKG